MAMQLTLKCADGTAAHDLLDELSAFLRARGMTPGTRSDQDYEACKRFMHAWRGSREIAGQANLGYERCVRAIADWVGV